MTVMEKFFATTAWIVTNMDTYKQGTIKALQEGYEARIARLEEIICQGNHRWMVGNKTFVKEFVYIHMKCALCEKETVVQEKRTVLSEDKR